MEECERLELEDRIGWMARIVILKGKVGRKSFALGNMGIGKKEGCKLREGKFLCWKMEGEEKKNAGR